MHCDEADPAKGDKSACSLPNGKLFSKEENAESNREKCLALQKRGRKARGDSAPHAGEEEAELEDEHDHAVKGDLFQGRFRRFDEKGGRKAEKKAGKAKESGRKPVESSFNGDEIHSPYDDDGENKDQMEKAHRYRSEIGFQAKSIQNWLKLAIFFETSYWSIPVPLQRP